MSAPKLKDNPLPKAMRAAKRWLLWKSIANGDKKPRKVPYYASGGRRSGQLDTPADAARLVTYAQAVKAMREGRYAGLGFALGGGWQGLDLDGCRDASTGVIADWAQEIISQTDTYAEISPSEKGIHLIGKGDESLRALGSNKSGVEFYNAGRYFTVTGVPLDSAPRPALRTLAPVYDLAAKRWQQFAPIPATDAGGARPASTVVSPLTWFDAKHQFKKWLPELIPDLDSREVWKDIGMAIKKECGGSEEGYQMWCEWSKGSDKYDEADQRVIWDSFKRNENGIGVGTIIMMAKAAKEARGEGKPRRREDALLPAEFTLDELDAMDIPATEWIVEGLIAPGLTLLAAPPKTGKSYLVMQMCMCVAAGVPFLDLETKPTRVTYFDLEEWHGLLRERVTPIRKGNNIPAGVPIKFVLETGVGAEAIAHIKREIAAGSKLIVVDIFARIRDELNENARQNAYARDTGVMQDIAVFALNNPGVAIVIVHHANKGNHDNWMNKVSGSAGMTGGAHTVMYMARPDMRGWDEEEKREGLKYRVLNASGKQVKEQEISLEMMDDDAGWKRSVYEPYEVNATFKQRKIVSLLRACHPEPMSSKEIAEELGLKQANVKKIAQRMVENGLLESEGRGGAGYRWVKPRD
jgi:hypothetical protein